MTRCRRKSSATLIFPLPPQACSGKSFHLYIKAILGFANPTHSDAEQPAFLREKLQLTPCFVQKNDKIRTLLTSNVTLEYGQSRASSHNLEWTSLFLSAGSFKQAIILHAGFATLFIGPAWLHSVSLMSLVQLRRCSCLVSGPTFIWFMLIHFMHCVLGPKLLLVMGCVKLGN